MKNKNCNCTTLILIAFLPLSGCLSKIDQTPPAAYENWKKSNVSQEAIKLAMLECGYPNLEGIAANQNELNEMALAQQCMKQNQFIHRKGTDLECFGALLPYSACQTNPPVPTRSVERRLNSPFCKDNPDSDLCTPDGQPIPQTNQPIRVAVISSKDGPTSPIDDTKTNARRQAYLLQQVIRQQNIHDFNQMQKNMQQTQRQSQNSLKR